MKTYTFKFKINAPKYAKRFGIEIPDDSMDDRLTDDGGVTAEDSRCYKDKPSECRIHGFAESAKKAIERATKGITVERLREKIEEFIDKKTIDVRVDDAKREELTSAALDFFKTYANKTLPLSTGSKMCFVPGPKTIDRYRGDNLACWAEYAIHAASNDCIDKKDGKHYRVFSSEKVRFVNTIIPTIVSDDEVYYDDKRKSVVFCKKLNSGSAKVIAHPMEDGNLVADLSDVTQIYSSKDNLPDRLVTLQEIAKEVEVAKGTLSHNHGLDGSIAQDEALCQWASAVVGDCIAEDANVDVDSGLLTPAQLACKTPLEKCKAKNPMTCRYHGAKAIANDIEVQLRAGGINGQANVNLLGVSGNTLSVQASITADEKDEKAVRNAMAAFFQLPGVEGDANDFMYEDADRSVGSIFDIDMIDPKAKARWGMGEAAPQGQNAPQGTAQPQQQPQQQNQQGQQQATASTQSPTPNPTPKKRPTRKRTGAAAAAVGQQQEEQKEKTEEPKIEFKEEQTETPPSVDDDENGPTLFPGEGLKEPPKWEPDYTLSEIDELKKMMVRLAKTARQINRNIDKGNTDAWLTKKAPNLPDSLQKFMNEIEPLRLSDLAEKDTDGQVKAMKDLMDEIFSSGSNGWKVKVAESKWDGNAPTWWDANKEGNVDIHFDEHKYDDPYAKERAAYDAYVPGSKGREDALKGLEQIDKSSAKDAPKGEANACREAAKQMSDIEEAFTALKGMSDVFKNAFGRAYYKANEAYSKAMKACKEWIGKQSVMQGTVEDTAAAFRAKYGRDALYLTSGLSKNLKDKRKTAMDICKSNSRVFAKDPDGCTAMFEKNAKFMFANGSIRFATSFAAVQTLLADPNEPDVSSGFKNGQYTPRYIDYDYIELAKCHFGAKDSDFDHGSRTEKSLRNIHKYGALFAKTPHHSGDQRSLGYGDIEVELDIRKCLAFWGGNHSQTRNSNLNLTGSNASLVTDPKITMAPYLYNVGGSLDELFTKDFTKEKNGWQSIFNILSRGGHSSHKGDRVPEVWLADIVSRDMVKGLYPYHKTVVGKIKKLNKKFIEDNGIVVSN